MLVIDDLTIIICTVLLLLTIASVLMDTFLKGVPKEDGMSEAYDLKPVSVVVIADNNARELNKYLPVFLSQDYPAGYEVIVVVSKNEDNTDDVLKSYMAQHDNLYTTFVPDSSRYMSNRKLAITLGVKAAKHNSILLTNAECCPNTDKWILSMATVGCGANASMVVGYSNYDADGKPFCLFSRLHRQYALMSEIKACRPYATVCCNLMFEKSMFMNGKGFQGNLKYLRGEYEFMVNKYGGKNIVAIATSPDSRMTEEAPTRMAYVNECLFYSETRRHLKRGLRHRVSFNLDMLSLHSCLLMAVLAGTYACASQNWLVLVGAVLSSDVPIAARTLTANRAIKYFGAPMSPVCAVIYEIRLVWHKLAVAIRHRRADKTDFISHKS